MTGQLNGVQTLVKEKIPNALFVHCFGHVLNLVLSQSLTFEPTVCTFFQTLSGLSAFFTRSSKRTVFLDEFVKSRLPKVSPTRWIYHSRLVHTVKENRLGLISLFEYIRDNPCDWDGSVTNDARGFLSSLHSFQFVFFWKCLLIFFVYRCPLQHLAKQIFRHQLLCKESERMHSQFSFVKRKVRTFL